MKSSVSVKFWKSASWTLKNLQLSVKSAINIALATFISWNIRKLILCMSLSGRLMFAIFVVLFAIVEGICQNINGFMTKANPMRVPCATKFVWASITWRHINSAMSHRKWSRLFVISVTTPAPEEPILNAIRDVTLRRNRSPASAGKPSLVKAISSNTNAVIRKKNHSFVKYAAKVLVSATT